MSDAVTCGDTVDTYTGKTVWWKNWSSMAIDFIVFNRLKQISELLFRECYCRSSLSQFRADSKADHNGDGVVSSRFIVIRKINRYVCREWSTHKV